MKTYSVHIRELPTADFHTYYAEIEETGSGSLRGDRLDAQGDSRLGAWFPGVSDHLKFFEGLTEEPRYVQTGSNSGVMLFRSREAEVYVHDIAHRHAEGSADLTQAELDQIIAALVSAVVGANTYPEEAVVRYIERLVDHGHVGIIHRVINLYCQGNRRSRSVIAGQLPRILSEKYRPILEGGGTAKFQLWAMQPKQKPLFEKLKTEAGNTLLPGVINDIVFAFEDRKRGRAA